MPSFEPLVRAQFLLRRALALAFLSLGIDLEEERGTLFPFYFNKSAQPHEDKSFWGILGFLLVWPCTLLAVRYGGRRVVAMGVAGLAFFFCQSFATYFTPWYARYHAGALLFLLPVAGSFLPPRGRPASVVLFLVFLLGSLSAVGAVTGTLYRVAATLPDGSAHTVSLFDLSRARVIALSGMNCSVDLIDRTVPATASLGIRIPHELPQYGLFGPSLGRKLVHGSTYAGELLPIPEGTEFLLYDAALEQVATGDIRVGDTLYIRDLRRNSNSR